MIASASFASQLALILSPLPSYAPHMIANAPLCPPEEDRFIYSEGIDCAKSGATSIWGTEDPLTVKALKQAPISGRWLDLCAGDGRFIHLLLERTTAVVACDIDESALEKLRRLTPASDQSKLECTVCNIVEPLPFVDVSFDGIFCTGTLHLFPQEIFRAIVRELERILKPGGRIILDFATDIRRERPDGSLYIVPHEPLWTTTDALNFLHESFSKFKITLQTSTVPPEQVVSGSSTWIFSSNFILLHLNSTSKCNT